MSNEKEALLLSQKRRYIFALALLVVFTVGSHILFETTTRLMQGNAAEINMAGRQRMLSQRITLLAERLDVLVEGNERASVRAEMAELISLMETSQNALLYGNNELGIEAPVSGNIKSQFWGPDGSVAMDVNVFLASAKGFLAQHTETTNARHEGHDHSAAINQLKEKQLLESIDRLVKEYQLLAEENLANANAIARITLVITLAVLLTTGYLVFRPMLHQVARAFDKIELARSQAEMDKKENTSFLTSISHELRTPLNSILGFVQVLENESREQLTESQKTAFNHIKSSGTQMLALTDQLLSPSCEESSDLAFNLEMVNATQVCQDAIAATESLASRKNIHIHGEMASGVFIEADYRQLKEALVMLLVTAIEKNRAGRHIILSCRRHTDERVRISLNDSGEATPSKNKEHQVKPPALRGNKNRVVDQQPAGLMVIRQMITAMGGKIGFDTLSNQDGQLWIEFKVISRGFRDTVEEKVASPMQTTGNTRTEGLVLYIEDNPLNMKLMESIVKPMKDVQLISATNAEDGLRIANKQKPDLIFMDINLPGMNGIEALKQLKRNMETRSIPVVALSADVTNRKLQLDDDTGFTASLSKPVHVPDVVATIQNHLPKITLDTHAQV